MNKLFHLLIVIVVFSCFLFPNNCSARTWYVKADQTGDAPTIQAAVDSSMVDDTALVEPGEYTHQLAILVFEIG